MCVCVCLFEFGIGLGRVGGIGYAMDHTSCLSTLIENHTSSTDIVSG